MLVLPRDRLALTSLYHYISIIKFVIVIECAVFVDIGWYRSNLTDTRKVQMFDTEP